MARLELNKETLRELDETQLEGVAGGNEITKYTTQSPVCPSGATWLQECAPPHTANCQ